MVASIHRADQRSYAPYLKAAWGFKNHWYPAVFSQELPEGAVKGIKICGMPILLRRVNGKVYAILDRCLHRGVKLSHRPTCLTDETITCWFHGYSFNLSDGKLMSIVASPDDEIIGKYNLQTFPVEEFRGIIFVFVGDEGYSPVPPLADDLPVRPSRDQKFSAAHLLDEDAVFMGIRQTVRANWRLAAETGIDPGHVLVHKDNFIVYALAGKRPQQLGYRPVTDDAVLIFDGDGPKGMMNQYGVDKYVPVTENKALNIVSPTGKDFDYVGSRTSIYLPGVLMVENFPEPGVCHFEWYVPIDDETHEYWRGTAANCPDEASFRAFETRFKSFYEPLALRDFNGADVDSSEQMQEIYADGGWDEEVLCELDAAVIAWRKLASRFNRGVQSPRNKRKNG